MSNLIPDFELYNWLTVVLDERHVHLLAVFSRFLNGSKSWFGFFPTMEAHGSLRMLLDTLLDKETLNSWNIYEEKSGAVVVRIRFSPRHTASHVGLTNVQNIGYKRKSPAQMARDQERDRSYNERRHTRSQARENGHTDAENIEKVRSDNESQFSDTGLSGLISPVLPALQSRLDPFVEAFGPNAPPLIKEHPSGGLASPLLEPACPAPDLPHLSPLSTLAADADVTFLCHGSETLQVDGKMVKCRCSDPDSGKPGCTNNFCMYGGGQGAVDQDFIYECKQCTGLASSSVCARCLINGWTCEPGHDQWELVTWTMHIYISVNYHHVITLYQVCYARGNPLPFLDTGMKNCFNVFLIDMGSCVCYLMYHGHLQ